jgi:hypothetical protein
MFSENFYRVFELPLLPKAQKNVAKKSREKRKKNGGGGGTFALVISDVFFG